MSDHTRRTYDSVLDMVSGLDNPTPLLRLHRVVPFEHTEVWAKLEWYNPFGAVKDRVAFNMIRDAQERGVVGPGQQFVEPTSGNTGLGLAMIANAHGYSLTTPLSDQIPVEKRTMLRLFGTEVLELEDSLCPAPGAPEGAIAKAYELGDQPGFHMLNQYANEANPDAHYRSTGPEIWRQTGGRITHFVAGLGTCGTITGVGRYLREQCEDVQVIGVHPAEGHDIPGVRSVRQLQQTRFFDPDRYDGLVEVQNEEAYGLCLRLNREESVTAGPSSGLALAGALRLVPDEPGAVAVVVFPDNAFKYASSVVKHLAGLGAPVAGAKSRREALLDAMVENARVNPQFAIDVEAAYELWRQEQPYVVDVRAPDQYATAHIPDSVNAPLLDLPEYASLLPEDRDAPMLSVCQRGNMSLSGALFLQSLGYRNARSVTGGLTAWQEHRFDTAAA